MITMYEKLLQLPLFQGMTIENMTNVVGKVRMHFSKVDIGDNIVNKGDDCNQLLYILSGEVEKTTSNDVCTLHEFVVGPYLVEPASLYGLSPKFRSTYTALTPVTILSIGKSFVRNELFNYNIFTLNFVNTLSRQVQRNNDRLWRIIPSSPENVIKQFILSRCESFEGPKIVSISTHDLAAAINLSDRATDLGIKSLVAKSLIAIDKGSILVEDVNKLVEP